MNRLYGTAIPGLEDVMRFRLARQGVLAANLANADTPGYRRFDVVLDEAAAGLRGTDPKHFSAPSDRYRVERGPKGSRPDGNGVDRDQEVIHMTRNAGFFQDVASVLSRIYAMRRMGATGELS